MPRGLLALILTLASAAFSAGQVDDSFLNGLHWRLVGPFRGGRAVAVAGIPSQPDTFYFGSVGGGVWLTHNAGRTWKPIFDKVSTASIGAVAVAPSDPKVIYVGTGEADMRSDIQQGDGMYKSVDGGKTWKHIGLTDSRQIGAVVIDPKDPNRVWVAALGHQYGPNAERGVYRTTDGGQSWKKVLSKNVDTGAVDLALDPSDSNVIYASMWQTRRPPWSVYPPSNGPGSGLYKSVDGGDSWVKIMGHGFPSKVGRIGLSISRSNPERVYACVDGLEPKDGGVYRSDDSGATWSHVGVDPRIWGRGWYFMGITADPVDPDTVYVNNTSSYRSKDGGKTWVAFKGAPGGDDNHILWINPTMPSHMILGTDQGVVVSLDGGNSWSSWYNQATGQFYHIVTDNRFPYWIYGSQQDSGAMAVPSRTIHTGVSALYQRPIDAGGESGTIAPDPLHKGLLFSSTGSKEQFETGWEQNIDPTFMKNSSDEDGDDPLGGWRSEWTQPIVNSPADPRVYYTSHQKVFRTANGGASWSLISLDLTRRTTDKLSNLDETTAADHDPGSRRGVVYWLAPSPIKAGQLWASTDDGLIWLTRNDGKHWSNVTPPGLTSWSKVALIDAGHFSTETAYAVVDRHRIDDNKPYIYKTHDGGKHWELIVNGIPGNQFVNVVREDPKQKGLLYAGTDWGIYVSFNDGENWQSLQQNLPTASVRDIVFGGNDVVVGTHGRAIWILDNVGLLRQMAAGSTSRLFKPDPAILFQRAGTFGFGRFDEGTPLPPEEVQGENAPWGAVIDYRLKATGPTVLSLYDAKGSLMQRVTSSDQHPAMDPTKMDIPAYWIQPIQGIENTPGGHRYVYDLRYRMAGNPLLPPGRYTVELRTGDSKSFTQPLIVKRDPRLPYSDADLKGQFAFILAVAEESRRVSVLRDRAQYLAKKPEFAKHAAELGRLAGTQVGRRRRPPTPSKDTNFAYVVGWLNALRDKVASAPSRVSDDDRHAFDLLKKMAKVDELKLLKLMSRS